MRRIPIAHLAGETERALEASEARHVSLVLRMRAGDAFVAFDPSTGREAEATVAAVDAGVVRARFGALRDGTVRAGRSIVWIQGLAKGDKCDAVVRDATELGATRIVVAPSRRSVVKLDAARAPARAERWRRIAREAARQSGRSDAPEVEAAIDWSAALESVDASHARFCLWESATCPLGSSLRDALAAASPVAFACGPEGGLEAHEVDVARGGGWEIASLGPRILRTETVAAAVLGAVAVWSAR